ncbi:hypothetical protein [Guptibacillus hwajinpoensis]|uniref:hypothetical protein n=1 Tax=Guptibacillus hwajinpoensis TaxID=208199 RepID=UPI0026575A34|nr:hypothetical protein [Alkalihalobacillus hemicentroti]
MKIQLIEGAQSKEARSKAYQHLKKLYGKENLLNNDWDLRSRLNRGTSEKRIQSQRAD